MRLDGLLGGHSERRCSGGSKLMHLIFFFFFVFSFFSYMVLDDLMEFSLFFMMEIFEMRITDLFMCLWF